MVSSHRYDILVAKHGCLHSVLEGRYVGSDLELNMFDHRLIYYNLQYLTVMHISSLQDVFILICFNTTDLSSLWDVLKNALSLCVRKNVCVAIL